MKDHHINIFYSDDDGGYIADIPDLEAYSAFGKTPDEALRGSRDRQGCLAQGRPSVPKRNRFPNRTTAA